MNGDGEYGAAPYQQALIDQLRQTPTLSMPTQGSPRPNTRQRATAAMEDVARSITQRPNVSEREGIARGQYEAAGEDIGPAILLQALGGKLAPMGGQILQRSLAARAPQRVTGGEYIGGRFVEDPYARQDRELKGKEFLARGYETQATHEETAAERERSHRANEQAKADAERRHQQQLGESRATRAATTSLAERRFEYEKGKDKYTLVRDKDSGEPIGMFNPATGKLEPLGGPGLPTGGPAGGPATPKLNEVQSRAFDAATKIGTGMKVIGSLQAAPSIGAITALTTSQPMKRAALNKLLSAGDQAYVNAAGNILAGILRKESGAAITAEEWATYGPQYLPWYGDDPRTVADKLAVLNSTHESYINQSGPSGSRTLRAGQQARPELPEGSLPDVSRETPSVLPRSTAPRGAGASAADYKKRVGLF